LQSCLGGFGKRSSMQYKSFNIYSYLCAALSLCVLQ
jgi:hypothetical protein